MHRCVSNVIVFEKLDKLMKKFTEISHRKAVGENCIVNKK